MKKIAFVMLCFLILISSGLSAQKKHHRGHHPRKVVVVKRSPYRPAKIMIYHPHWRPAYGYHRRWIYFPKYNLYWDNWRNHYVFWNGSVWVSQTTTPTVIINVNLDKEKHSELKEDEDDVDDIYKSNDTHKTEYKAD